MTTPPLLPLIRMSRRERAARAVYRLRPFRTAMSTAPLERDITQSRLFEFDAAPVYYVADCFDVADAVLEALRPSRARAIGDTHPKDGDALAAPLVSGAGARSAIAQPESPSA